QFLLLAGPAFAGGGPFAAQDARAASPLLSHSSVFQNAINSRARSQGDRTQVRRWPQSQPECGGALVARRVMVGSSPANARAARGRRRGSRGGRWGWAVWGYA